MSRAGLQSFDPGLQARHNLFQGPKTTIELCVRESNHGSDLGELLFDLDTQPLDPFPVGTHTLKCQPDVVAQPLRDNVEVPPRSVSRVFDQPSQIVIHDEILPQGLPADMPAKTREVLTRPRAS